MAEAKALYNNQGNRGSAFILNNGWQTPLGMVQQQEEVKRQEQIRGEQVKAQREKEAADQLRKLYETDFGSFWDRDHAYVNEALSGIHDKAAEYSMQGVNWSNPLTNPQEFAEIQRGIQEARRRYNISDQQYKQYQGLLDLSNKDEDGIYDKERIKAELENYAKATPEERANMVLAADKYYNIANVANGLFKGYEPQAETTYSTNGKGGITHRTVKTYSPEQLDKMAGLLREDTKFKASVKSDFNSLDDEQKKAAGGLEGFMQTRAKEVAELYQRKDVEEKYGVDSSFWQEKNYSRLLAKDNEGKIEEEDAAIDRAKFMEALRTGDINKATSLINSKLGGNGVVNAKFVDNPTGKVVVPGGKVSGTKDLYGRESSSPIIELELDLGEVTMDGADGKTKSTQTRKVQIDLSDPNWRYKFNNIYDTLVGEKRKVSNESLDKAAKKLGLFQEGSQTYQASKDDPFADFDQPAADPNDPFADFN